MDWGHIGVGGKVVVGSRGYCRGGGTGASGGMGDPGATKVGKAGQLIVYRGHWHRIRVEGRQQRVT